MDRKCQRCKNKDATTFMSNLNGGMCIACDQCAEEMSAKQWIKILNNAFDYKPLDCVGVDTNKNNKGKIDIRQGISCQPKD